MADYLTTLSAYLCDTRLDDLPPPVVERGRWVIADSLAVIAAGMQTPEMGALIAKQVASAATGGASVIGAGVRTDSLCAAFLNGTAGTWLELDEGNFHAKGHPGIQVVPAALAAAEDGRKPGREFLRAVILGYEACSRINRASETRPALHPHGTYGPLGAAVAVASLMDYEAPAMRSILNIGATLGLATSWQSLADGATVRNVYTGMSGHMGLLAHRLIEAGLTGEADGVRSVFGSVYAERFDADLVVRDLGREFLIERNYFKLHSAARLIHTALDVLTAIMARQPGGRIGAETVEHIDIEGYYRLTTVSQKSVTTSFGAKFSLEFAVATLLFHGRPGLANFEATAVANPVIQGLIPRVQVRENPAFTAAFPDRQPCTMRITFKDGSVAEAMTEITKGEADNPHSRTEMEDKFFGLADPVWGADNARAAFVELMALEDVADIHAFTERHRM